MKEKIISLHGAPDRTTSRRRMNSRQRILVVEDDDYIRRLNFEALIRAGYNVDAAVDGAAGWEALQLNGYHLLITDSKMPRVSGIDLVKKLHSARMALPVIMATGKCPQEELNRHPWLQIDATLLKPYTTAQLLAAVGNVLRVTDGFAPLPNLQSWPPPNISLRNSMCS